MVLVDKQGDGTSYKLRASFQSNGDLVLEGHDLSSWCEEMGRDEYEYFYTVHRSNVPRICELLGATEGDLLECIRDLLALDGITASTTWKLWLKANRVPYAFAVR